MEQIQEETILALLIDKPAEGIRILTAQYGGLVYSITWRRLQGCLRKEDIEECVSHIFGLYSKTKLKLLPQQKTLSSVFALL